MVTLEAPRRRKPPIPLYLFAGRRGAGKTRAINRLLGDPGFDFTSVILNDFGATQLAGKAAGAAGDGPVMLGSGCVCCSVRGELVVALEDQLRGLDNRRIERIDRVVIETNGEADPVSVLANLMRHPYLSMRYRPSGIVVAVGDLLPGDDVSAVQRACADLVVVSDDEADGHNAASLAPVIARGALNTELLQALAFWSDDLSGAWPAGGGDLLGFTSFGFTRTDALESHHVDALAGHLVSQFETRLLKVRVDSVVNGARTIQRLVSGTMLPPVSAPTEGEGGLHVWAILPKDDAEAFRAAIDAFTGGVSIDRPDRTALTDNPLAVAGFSARPGGRR